VLVLEAFEPLSIEDEDEHDLKSLSWGLYRRFIGGIRFSVP